MSNTIWVATDGETAARNITHGLTRRGGRVFRSFDLRSAAAHWGREAGTECQCPHHGTQKCTCEYLVLLAYGPDGTTAVITVHSRDGRSEVQVVHDPNAPAETGSLSAVALAVLEAAEAVQPEGVAEAGP